MTKLISEIRINAPKERVWEVLADLGSISKWNPGVSHSYSTSPETRGEGAMRHCDLQNVNGRSIGYLKERAFDWRDGEGFTIDVYESNLPLKRNHIRFDLVSNGDGTIVTITPDYALKFGPLGVLADLLIGRRQLKKGMAGLAAGLKYNIETGGLVEKSVPETSALGGVPVPDAEQTGDSVDIGRRYRFERLALGTVMRDMYFSKDDPAAGDRVPDFDLPTLGGGRFRSSDLSETGPVLLIFGSYTCPVTDSAAPGLKELHGRFGDRVRFVMVNVREAHPGKAVPQPETMDQKTAHAEQLGILQGFEFEVAVDDIDGTLHHALSPKPNSAYVLAHISHMAEYPSE